MEYRKNGPVSVRTVHQDVAESDENVPSLENASEIALSKRCAIKHCRNTFDSSPSKIFFPLPRISTYIRSMWLKTIGMASSYSGNDIYCCEDHFDLHKDVKSVALLKDAASGGVQSNLLKSTVFPHFNIRPPPSPPLSSPEPEKTQKTPAAAPIRVKTIEEVNRDTNDGLPPARKPGRPPKGTRSPPKNPRIVSTIVKEKICLVPHCKIKSSDSVDVFHVCVPFSKDIRVKWLEAMGVKPTARLFSDTIHVCTKHFEVDELETFATPNQQAEPGSTKKMTYMRAKHGVTPSVNLRPEEPAKETPAPEPDLDNSPFSDEGLPPPVVVLKPVKFENEENGDEDLLVYEQIPRPIVLDDDEMEKKPTPPALEDPLAEDNQAETADGNQGLLTLEEELHQRLISTKDDTVHLAFPSDEYSKLTTVQFPRDRNRHHVCPKCNQSYAHRRLLEDHIMSCEGTNPVTVDMYQLIEWTTLLSEKIAEVQGIENAINCRVVLNRKETLTPPDPLAEKPRVRKKPVPKPSNKRKAKTDTKTVTEEPTPAVAENNEDVDILGQSDNAEEIVPNKRTRRGKKDDPAVSSSTDDTVPTKGKTLRSGRMVEEPADVPSVVPPPVPPAAPPAKKPRGRRNIRFREPPSEDDELMEPDVDDPDFNPLNEIPARKRKSALGRNYIDYEPDDSSGDESAPVKKAQGYRTSAPTMIPCGICGSVFATVQGLRYHHRMSARCGKQNLGANFKCDVCTKVFGSQTSLDEHRAKVKVCKRDQSEDLDILTCEPCLQTFQSLYELRYHLKASAECSAFSQLLPNRDEVLKTQEEPKTGHITCKGCNVAFNSTVGFGLHLKRSLKCVQANPDVDIPGVVDRNAKVLLTAQGQSVKIDSYGSEDNTKEDVVYMCEHCCSSFSSIWGLRTHERNSVGCKPDRPYEIPVPIPKSLADKLKKEFKEKKEKEREESKDKNEETPPAPSTTLVYSQLVPNADGKYKCSCEAVFNSIWGFRSHQRMSEKCKSQGPGENLIYRPSVSKKISLPPTAAKNSEAAPNVCPCCSARFSTPVGLRCHFRHSPDCGSTEAAPKRVDNTSDATVTSSGQVKASPGVYLCPCCPKDFKLPASLEQHFIEHAAEADSWVCCECDQIFADQFILHRHFHKDHMGQWFCVMCLAEDLEAPNISTFKEFYTHIFGLHSNGHQSKEFAHKCMICLRSFATKGSLKLHTTTCKKSAEQKFSCASCGKVFSKKIHLNSHMRFSHPDIDVDPRFKYKCPNCPQRYMTEDELLVDHAKEGCITPGDVCDLCGEIYYIRGGLEAHMKAAHSQTVHSTRQGRPPKVGIEPSTPGNATDVDDCGEISSSLDIDVPSIVKIESMSPQSPD